MFYKFSNLRKFLRALLRWLYFGFFLFQTNHWWFSRELKMKDWIFNKIILIINIVLNTSNKPVTKTQDNRVLVLFAEFIWPCDFGLYSLEFILLKVADIVNHIGSIFQLTFSILKSFHQFFDVGKILMYVWKCFSFVIIEQILYIYFGIYLFRNLTMSIPHCSWINK